MSSTDLIIRMRLFKSHFMVIIGRWKHPTTHLPAAPTCSVDGIPGLHQSIFLMEFFSFYRLLYVTSTDYIRI